MSAYTALQVAQWMLNKLKTNTYLYQEEIVYDIARKFGEPHYYTNDNGNYAISKQVLKEFRKLTPNVVWDRSEKCWRKRERYDEAGKRQAE